MDSTDKVRLFDLLCRAYIAKGRPAEQVTAQVLDVWVGLLPEIPVNYVERALTLHSRDADYKHPPTPADVLAIIRERTGLEWPTPDEAWAIAVDAMDEAETVVWCDEIAKAWGIAKEIAVAGDNIGARMAFRDAYRRLVKESQEKGQKARWWPSVGHDPDRRQVALETAVGRGLLTTDSVAKHPALAQSGGLALLTGNVVAHPTAPEDLKQRLAGLRAALSPGKDPDVRIDVRIEETPEVEQKRRAAQAMAAPRQEGGAA